MAGDTIRSPKISIQSTQLRSDLVVPENPVTKLCWKGIPGASNAQRESGSSVVREVMQGLTSRGCTRALGRLIRDDVGSDESELDPSSLST